MKSFVIYICILNQICDLKRLRISTCSNYLRNSKTKLTKIPSDFKICTVKKFAPFRLQEHRSNKTQKRRETRDIKMLKEFWIKFRGQFKKKKKKKLERIAFSLSL